MRNSTLTLICLALAGFGGTPNAMAEDLYENVVVTGSRIEQAEPGGVYVMDRHDIERSGARTLTDVVRDLVHASSGTVDERFTQGFAPASAGINLRGLGVNRTLVLLDGQRMPVFPFGQEGSESFVDINLIPLAAIERIEVLKDGASAIYGSDAVAGVVNIITRDAAGAHEATFEHSTTSKSDGETTRVSASTGYIGDSAEFTFAVDYMNRTPIWARDRKAGTANGPIDDRSNAGNPGTFITSVGPQPDANCPADRLRGPFCTYDFAQDVTLVPGTERLGFFASWDQDLTDSTGAYASLLWSQSESSRDLAGAPNAYPVAAANPNNPFGEDVLAIYRLLELGPRRDSFETEAYNFHAGVNGYIAEWHWDLRAGTSEVDTAIRGVNGYALASDVQAAIDAGTLNVFGDSPSFDPESVMFESRRTGISKLNSLSLSMRGTPFETSAGSAGMAFGMEYRREDFSDRLDPTSSSGAVVGVGGTSADGDRDVASAYAELGVPLTSAVTLQLAWRYDHYDDFGSSHSPKVGIEWRAGPDLSLHASYGTGFKAPALHELYAGDIFAFESVFDTTQCNAARAANDAAGVTTYCDSVREVMSTASGNPLLSAEESDHWVAGVEWNREKVYVGAQYWVLTNDNAVTSSPQFYVDNEAAHAANVTRDGNGDLASVTSPFANVAAQELWGVDFDAGMTFATDGAGTFEPSMTVSYLGEFRQQPSPGEPTEDLAGKDGNVEWRLRAGLDWSMHTMSAGLGVSHIDSYERRNPGVGVDSWTTVDLHVYWSPSALRGGRIGLAVEDLTDAHPPEDPFLSGWPFFNRALHHMNGRTYALSYHHAF